jgi:hypothetical protein
LNIFTSIAQQGPHGEDYERENQLQKKKKKKKKRKRKKARFNWANQAKIVSETSS